MSRLNPLVEALRRGLDSDYDQYLDDCGAVSLDDLRLGAPVTAVYFLMSDGVVVYVGQSVDLLSRLAQHGKQKTGLFDSARVIVCKDDELNSLERQHIEALTPTYNISLITPD